MDNRLVLLYSSLIKTSRGVFEQREMEGHICTVPQTDIEQHKEQIKTARA